ncbi:GIY-YIG nuclease family protein [Flavobacterium sp. UBA7663]|uniref:GIY-YIG nuclease family protein n=1 Tax=Flavobacterium sp. UBA7663 TaxID=1946557 RepID=UPI0025C3E803|nr:GIY-YIG nuclease family protein [Flavobacterium sp. UBA7663]
MENLQEFQERFESKVFSLSREDILELEKFDNGPLNNVITRINKHCYGVSIIDEEKIKFDMFYVNSENELKGDLIRLTLNEKNYFQLLMRFTAMLAEDYEDVDAISAFNTFQTKLRGFLEKLNFFTTTSLELKPYLGKGSVMISTAPRGIVNVILVEHKEFYREFFNNNYKIEKVENSEYVYLMVNSYSGYIKIGRSKNPRYREKTLHSQEPTISLIAQWQCSKHIEKELHEKFKSKRVRGEWFRLQLNDLKEIETFMSIYNCS